MPRQTPRGLLLDDHVYTQEEQRELIGKMRAANNSIYLLLQAAGVHAFIEHCGLLSKFIDIAERSMQAGIDFTQSNTHSEGSLAMEGHDMEYLAEKLDCIYGPSLRANAKVRAAFLKGLGLDEEPVNDQRLLLLLTNAYLAGQAMAFDPNANADLYAVQALRVYRDPSLADELSPVPETSTDEERSDP